MGTVSEKARIATTDRERLATRSDIVDAKTELTSDVGEIAALFCQINERMDRMELLMASFDQSLWELRGTLRSQTRILFTATLCAMIGVGGLAFVAAAFI